MGPVPPEINAAIDRSLFEAGVLAELTSLTELNLSSVVENSARLVLVQLHRLSTVGRFVPPQLLAGPVPGSVSLAWVELSWLQGPDVARITVNPRGPRLTVWAYVNERTLIEGSLPTALLPLGVLTLLTAVTHR